ncbi:MAG: OmpH family outer membrane protein [Bacteroidota bacterium]
MNKLIKFAMFACLLLVATATSMAQNFGYVNSSAILAEMAEVRAAEADLEALQNQLRARGEGMVTDFQTEVQAFQQQVELGELSPQQQATKTQELEAKQLEIQQFESKMMTDLQNKRTALLEPIYDRVNAAIKEVAEEGDYTFIFDQQILLYGQDSQDVSAQVKAKLGMK